MSTPRIMNETDIKLNIVIIVQNRTGFLKRSMQYSAPRNPYGPRFLKRTLPSRIDLGIEFNSPTAPTLTKKISRAKAGMSKSPSSVLRKVAIIIIFLLRRYMTVVTVNNNDLMVKH